MNSYHLKIFYHNLFLWTACRIKIGCFKDFPRFRYYWILHQFNCLKILDLLDFGLFIWLAMNMFWLNLKVYNLEIQSHFLSLTNPIIFSALHNIFTIYLLKFHTQFVCLYHFINIILVLSCNFQSTNV